MKVKGLLILPIIIFLLFLSPLVYAQPTLELSSSSGYVEDKIDLKLTNFTPNSTINIFWTFFNSSKIAIASGETDKDGKFNVTIKIPQDKGGKKILEAIDKLGLKANVSFTLLPKIYLLSLKEKPSEEVSQVEIGSELMALGSGGVEDMLIFIDNQRYDVKPEIEENGKFSFEFLALGSAGTHGITLVSSKGKIFHSFLFNVTGVTNEILMGVEVANHFTLRDISNKFSDFIKNLFSLGIRMDENTALLRGDVKVLTENYLKASKETQAKIASNITETRKELSDLLGLVSSKVDENTKATLGLERNFKDINERLDTFKDSLSSLERAMGLIRQDISSSFSSTQASLSAIRDELMDLSSELDRVLSSVKAGFEDLLKVDRESLQNISYLVLSVTPQLLQAYSMIQLLILVSIIIGIISLILFFLLRGKITPRGKLNG
ncbi:MAG: hypothetical protein QXX95_03285 [Nitrososphaerales archaeon]